MNYKQIHSVYEDGIGKTTFTVMLATNYNELFVGTEREINFIDINSITKELEDQTGSAIENELKFTFNNSKINTLVDLDAYGYLTSAFDAENKIYIAVFINTGATPLLNDSLFIGILDTDRSEEVESYHNDGEFSVTFNPVKKISMTSKPHYELKEIPVTELINDISESWESENVNNRLAWFESDYHTNKRTVVHDIVSLNKLLRELGNILAAKLTTAFGINTTISFVGDDLPFDLLPARWTRGHTGNINEPLRYVNDEFGDWETRDRYFSVFADDSQTLRLAPDETLNENQDIWIDYKTVKLIMDKEPNPKEAKKLQLSEIESFYNLLYSIAENFHLYLSVNYSANNNIEFRFHNVFSFSKPQVYFKNATSDKIELSKTTQSDEDKKYIALANYYTVSGNDMYDKDNNRFYPSKQYNETEDGARLLFTVSPTIVIMYDTRTDYGFNCLWIKFPHNHAFANSELTEARSGAVYVGNISTRYSETTSGLHTAIYMKVNKRIDENNAPDSYFTPAAKVLHKADGSNREFETLVDYLNFTRGRNKNFFQNEREIEVPFINGFSLNADGSNPSWKNLQLGNKIVFDNAEFIVVGIEYDIPSIKTKISLQRIERFSNINRFDNPSVEQIENISQIEANTPENYPDIYIDKQAAIDIPAFTVISIDSNGNLEPAKALQSYYGKIVGITISNTLTGAKPKYIKSGEVVNQNWNWNIGQYCFLRFENGNYEITQNSLTEKNGNEDLWFRVGKAIKTDTIEIDYQEFILE
jgi:hypothetical protein